MAVACAFVEKNTICTEGVILARRKTIPATYLIWALILQPVSIANVATVRCCRLCVAVVVSSCV